MKQHNKNINSKYNSNISTTSASLHPKKINILATPVSNEFGLNILNNNSSDIDLHLDVNNVIYKSYSTMTANVFTNAKSKR